MSTEVGPVCECFAAARHRTVVWSLASMGAQVAAQKPRSRKLLTAHTAHVAHSVRKNMHRQRRHGNIHLPTIFTAFGVARVEAPMCLLVTGEVGGGSVALPALVTVISVRFLSRTKR